MDFHVCSNKIQDWVVVWNMFYFSIYIRHNHPTFIFSEGFKPPTRRISLGFFALDRHMLQSRQDHLPFVRVWEIGANMGDCSFLATGKQWYTVHGFLRISQTIFGRVTIGCSQPKVGTHHFKTSNMGAYKNHTGLQCNSDLHMVFNKSSSITL